MGPSSSRIPEAFLGRGGRLHVSPSARRGSFRRLKQASVPPMHAWLQGKLHSLVASDKAQPRIEAVCGVTRLVGRELHGAAAPPPRLSSDHGPAAGCRVARQREARRADLAAGRAEGARPPAQARTSLTERRVLRPASPGACQPRPVPRPRGRHAPTTAASSRRPTRSTSSFASAGRSRRVKSGKGVDAIKRSVRLAHLARRARPCAFR